MLQHKIQSSGGDLVLQLNPVPKLLGTLTREWAPNAFCTSFKLETDDSLLERKAAGALHKYSVDLVIANMLQVMNDYSIKIYSFFTIFTITIIIHDIRRQDEM